MKYWFAPAQLGSKLLTRNRIVLAPMTNMQSQVDGSLGEDELRFLSRRAEGGFGTILTCASHVSLEGQGWPNELGIFADTLVPGLAHLAKALSAHGAMPLIQLFHGGIRADKTLVGDTAWGPSAKVLAESEAREATEMDIEKVIGQFARAAQRAELAGMKGVELHGAHGYLLGQFLSSIDNQRRDRWGGGLENRARLLREVLRHVRSAVSSAMVVGVRLSPEDFGNARGLDLDENLQVARWLVEDGVDYLHLSLWHAQKNTQKRPTQHALTAFRTVVPERVSLMVAGGVWSPVEVEALFALGADFIALGRAALCNPDWPRAAAAADFEPRRPPLSVEELRERALGPNFVEYMARWKGFVAP